MYRRIGTITPDSADRAGLSTTIYFDIHGNMVSDPLQAKWSVDVSQHVVLISRLALKISSETGRLPDLQRGFAVQREMAMRSRRDRGAQAALSDILSG